MSGEADGAEGGELYFAYGSNLDEAQMRGRCAGAVAVGCALLRGHALAFGGFSRRWQGAVATVVPREGATVAGRLYALGADDLEMLDRFEGHPHSYARVVREVEAEGGGMRVAYMYLLANVRGERVTPAPAYLALLERAYARLGFDAAALATAAAASGDDGEERGPG